MFPLTALTRQFVRKDRFPAPFVAGLLETRQTLFLCQGCERKMPQRWERQHSYVPLDRFRGSGECEYCQEACIGTLFLPEEGGYHQEMRRYDAFKRQGTRLI